MINKVRAKFTCVKNSDSHVVLEPVYSEDPNHENKLFWDATPSGRCEMWIVVEDTANFFELNQDYYLDFTKAD